MSVTVTAEFDSVDFAERAAKKVRTHFAPIEKITIRCRRVDSDLKGTPPLTIVPVQSSFSTYFEAAAYNPIDRVNSENTSYFRTEVDDRTNATLEIVTDLSKADKVAGFLISCGGVRVQKM